MSTDLGFCTTRAGCLLLGVKLLRCSSVCVGRYTKRNVPGVTCFNLVNDL